MARVSISEEHGLLRLVATIYKMINSGKVKLHLCCKAREGY